MLNLKSYRQKPELCGPACLKMVLEYYGIQKNEDELANLAGYVPSEGVKVDGLINAATKLGLNAFYKDFSEIKDLKEYVLDKKIPVIVDWFSTDDGHYSVVIDIDDKNIYMQDPELGNLRTLDVGTFKRVWFDFRGDYLKSKDDIIIRRMIVVNK
jgi:predicted double-glycine peptidase